MARSQLSTSFLLLAILVTGCGKASITNECRMSGSGHGSCSFTNTGTSAGAICGIVTATSTQEIRYLTGKEKPEVASSTTFCSGEVGPSSTVSVDFFVQDAERACRYGCELVWTEK